MKETSKPLGLGCTVFLLTLMCVPVLAQDGHFDWPVGDRVVEDGPIVLTHEWKVLQSFANNLDTAPFPGQAHAGIDISRLSPVDGDDKPVYAAADGVVACTNRANDDDARRDYPGKVVVIRHDLPDGTTLYSQYAHLNFCQDDDYPCADNESFCDPDYDDEENPPPCVQEGDTVSRGEQIGTITRFRKLNDSGVWVFVPGNTHLHFEIRDFLYWDYDNDVPTSTEPNENQEIGCAGRGYAPASTKVLDDGYMDPVAQVHEHRPPMPATAFNWSVEERSLRDRPTTEGSMIVTSVPADAELVLEGSVRDEAFECGVTDCREQCTTKTECYACGWWYRVRYTNESDETFEGFISALRPDFYGGAMAVGEPKDREGEPFETEGEPLLSYYFDHGDAEEDDKIGNGNPDGALFTARVIGPVSPASPDPDLDPGLPAGATVLQLDGGRAFVETEKIFFDASEPFQLDLRVRRETNDGVDVVAGQWDPDDETARSWRLAFVPSETLPSESGELELRAILGGEETVLRFKTPDCDTLGRFQRLGVSFAPEDGLRLYWNGRQVAAREAGEGETLELASVDAPVRIGGVSSEETVNDPDRLDGALYDFKLWGSGTLDLCDILDLSFVIDDTGSMWDDIAAVRAAAALIVGTLNEICDDVRISVVTYNDPTTRVRLDFTSDTAATLAAINALSAGGGGDFPEYVLSGLATSLGLDWRPEARRAIILIGDAPPKDPEPGTGLTSDEVIAAAKGTDVSALTGPAPAAVKVLEPGLPIRIYSIHIGSHLGTREAFRRLAEETGGKLFLSPTAQDVVAAILEAIGDIGEDPPNQPPDISGARASVEKIWPPNHRMHSVQVENVTDPDGDPVTITITGITQDEPVPGPGQKSSPDGDGVGTDTAWVRGERDGSGKGGRVYEISFTAADDKGGMSAGSVFVCVPHDQGINTACVDDGQLYDSTVP